MSRPQHKPDTDRLLGTAPGPSPSLSAMAGRQARGSRDRALREGRRGCWRSLCARGLYCFLLPLRVDQLAYLRANTGQSDHTKRRGGRGICDLNLSRRAELLFAGPRLALRACPHTAGSRLPLIARARGWWECAPLGSRERFSLHSPGGSHFLKGC